MILTNQADAQLRYSRRVTDTTKFSPLFVRTLSWVLAAELAGPVLKGDSGVQAAARCEAVYRKLLGEAAGSDANDRQIKPRQNVPWVAGR